MGPLDKLFQTVAPGWAAKRAKSRAVLNYYEAAKVSLQRKRRRATGSADSETRQAGASLREQARYLEQNHDLARGVLRILVNNTVGPAGIGIEPRPRRANGEIHPDLASEIENHFEEWAKHPEVTFTHAWPSAQRLVARSMFRDGEALGQHLSGSIKGLTHGSPVPYSLELFEADYLPMDKDDERQRIRHGIQFNAWGRPVRYHVLKRHPGMSLFTTGYQDTRPIDAEKILYVGLYDRLHQSRGVSIFASVLGRLEDVKDYEESERIAAKVAASMAAFIRKGSPDQYAPSYDENGEEASRDMHFVPGMVFDDLLPGEEIGTIDTSRPNTNLEPYRGGQLRAVAAGTGVSGSSVSKSYDQGSYSAQRQELIESWVDYAVLSNEIVTRFIQPVYERFVSMAILSGRVVLPPDVNPLTITKALYLTPQMPWIDPYKEAMSMHALERHGHASGPEIIRKRGQRPADVLEQESRWRKRWNDAGMLNESDPAVDKVPEKEVLLK